MLTSWIGLYDQYDGYGFWAAIGKSSGMFLGWFHLRPGDAKRPHEPELGYRLRREAWGHGYATEGSRALIDKAFVELGAARVYASTMTVNAASRRVMEKAGLRYVRTFDIDWPFTVPGDEQGGVEYSITRTQWAHDRAAS